MLLSSCWRLAPLASVGNILYTAVCCVCSFFFCVERGRLCILAPTSGEYLRRTLQQYFDGGLQTDIGLSLLATSSARCAVFF